VLLSLKNIIANQRHLKVCNIILLQNYFALRDIFSDETLQINIQFIRYDGTITNNILRYKGADGKKIIDNPKLFENDEENNKIKEYVYKGHGVSGNPQRNYALTKITNPNALLYYLDDDNIINPSIYGLMNIIDNTKIYTFKQHIKGKVIREGNNISRGKIDTAMVIIPFNLCKEITWKIDCYAADGYYIMDCYNNNNNNNQHVYVDNVLCYYNKLRV
jgi:hypothetical protein